MTSLPAFFTQTLSGPVDDPSKLPKWNFDGSSTGQAPGDDSEVILWYHSPVHSPSSPWHVCLTESLVTALLLTRCTNSPSPLFFFLASSSRAIFRDPFRKGKNILVTRDHPFADSLCMHESWSWVWRETIHPIFELFVGYVRLLRAKWKTDSEQQAARGGDDL